MALDIELLEKALNHTTQRLNNVTLDQYQQPTPCNDFDVRALANHLVVGNPYYITLAQGGALTSPSSPRTRSAPSSLGRSTPGARRMLSPPGGPRGMQRQMPLPDCGTGPRVADLHLLEAVLHRWELATATGQDRTGDPAALQAVHDRWYGDSDEIRAHTGLFGPSKPAPDDAPALDPIAACFGRTVRLDRPQAPNGNPLRMTTPAPPMKRLPANPDGPNSMTSPGLALAPHSLSGGLCESWVLLVTPEGRLSGSEPCGSLSLPTPTWRDPPLLAATHPTSGSVDERTPGQDRDPAAAHPRDGRATA
ncbi:hypothetical protein GCM10010211_73740 [Streptomyces albospinus]|uniref:Mycothiol-dependent maleylpyruvate isomerase metal-binding domain-containing protein n=1 Tax=Streptomyces albospinus TaxID=285515 RepID=A0ABQ2VLH7_9ACTN|nr:TIGR03086 family metal-binding protein [Streptomyces albospinus]GGU95881.1 hypothetical protein GCM10010211_73740 [Streptomyces albospinus]